MNPENRPQLDMDAFERALDPNWVPNMDAFEADLLGDMGQTVVQLGETAIGNPELGSPYESGAIIDGPLTLDEVNRIAAQLAEEDVAVSETDMALMPGIENMLSNASIAESREIRHKQFHESVILAAAAFMTQILADRAANLRLLEEEDDDDGVDSRVTKRRSRDKTHALAA